MFSRMHIKVLKVIQLQKFNIKIIMKVSSMDIFLKRKLFHNQVETEVYAIL